MVLEKLKKKKVMHPLEFKDSEGYRIVTEYMAPLDN
jgi:hypothetical protein